MKKKNKEKEMLKDLLDNSDLLVMLNEIAFNYAEYKRTGDFSYISQATLKLVRDREFLLAFNTLTSVKSPMSPIYEMIKKDVSDYNALLHIIFEEWEKNERM